MTTQEKAAALRESLPQFTGSEVYHRVTRGPVVATDGVKHLCETAGAFWLMDIIGSYQNRIARKAREAAVAPASEIARKWNGLDAIQFWELFIEGRSDGHRGAVVTCRADSDIPPAITQRIEYTNFPLDEGIKLFVASDGNGGYVAMLPGEY